MRRKHGFGIVESLIALVVTVVVLGGLVQLLTGGKRMAQRSEDRLDPRERGHLALQQIRLALMDAWSYEIIDDGARVRFRSARISGELFREAGSGAVVLRTADGSRRLACGQVGSLVARELAPGLLRVELELKRSAGASASSAGNDLRMVQEVLIPTVALHDPTLPVRQAFDPAQS